MTFKRKTLIQMTRIIPLMILLLICHLGYAETVNIDHLEEKVYTAFNEKSFEGMKIEIDGYLEMSPSSPGLWYIIALWYELMARQKYIDAGKVSTDTVKSFLRKKNEAFAKAMELDIDHEPHLTAGQYHHFATGLPTDLKVEAYRRELKLGGAAEYPAGRVDLYYRISGAYRTDGRFEEALEVLKQMLDDPQIDPSYHDNIRSAIHRREQELFSTQSNSLESEGEDDTDKNAVAKRGDNQAEPEVVTVEPETPATVGTRADETEIASNTYNLVLIVVGVILFGIIIIYLVRVNRRK